MMKGRLFTKVYHKAKTQSQQPEIYLWWLGNWDTTLLDSTSPFCLKSTTTAIFTISLLIPLLVWRFTAREKGLCGALILPALVSSSTLTSSNAHFLPCGQTQTHIPINNDGTKILVSARVDWKSKPEPNETDLPGMPESNFWNRFIIMCNHG